jgi:hypothetical protein
VDSPLLFVHLNLDRLVDLILQRGRGQMSL